ncbi:MBL fold metallo-hydrolase [Flavihumibacter petaseus]|uniref:Putative hydrolase n=1 Tax=Flavihumibacter petaseus NBRC 106054 TaxID=1220578 RepID=A0A0E9MVB1_9BACT|nr:MBL fold metallo-hydrolase [Flavihumibacter petaseus]GAO41070.1 putative hydrolase [Flavihumibacter petaseus NBRC 106054]
MPLFITSLNSGSNGNCYYIGNQHEAILVDAGISCREIEKRMSRLGLSITSVRAVFVSHEHGDHITGIPQLSKKHRVPVYITKDTHREAAIPIEEELIRTFQDNVPVSIGDLTILPFLKNHDACDPHSFVVTGNGVTVGIFTDIGVSCSALKKHFGSCHAAFLESNYCEQMLEKGNYPFHLKRRISGGKGHLSNRQAFDLFVKHRSDALRHLVLSHLSKNNNHPDIVEALFRESAGTTRITVASRYHEMPVLTVTASLQLSIF